MGIRLLLFALILVVAVQFATVTTLQIVTFVRKRRKPIEGFPYLFLTETHAGENALHVYSRGRELYDAMVAAIEYAKESIYLESFLFKGDAIGKEFKKHLEAKAAQGVDVRVLYDGFGNLVVAPRFKRFPKPILARGYWSIRRPWHILDPRRYTVDHRKLLIVDGHIAFIGGYNIGQLYATEWRDTHLRIRGPAAADLAHSFVEIWNRWARKAERIERHYPRTFEPFVSIWGNDALRLVFAIRDMYIKAIERAEHSIRLTNAYFIPDQALLTALRAAAQRGVDVQVLVPWASNHVFADWLSRTQFTWCLKGGIRIFRYRRAMIHAKTCTVDGQWSTIGTANLDRLSAVGNYEVNVEIYSADLAKQMEELFECDKTNALELTLDAWLARPWYVKLSETILAPLRVLG
jgi:cardiolipin synthase A/B